MADGKRGWNLIGPDSDRLDASGPDHYAWKGDDAKTSTKRERAQRMYELGPCVKCGEPGVDRHHVDGDTGNNDPSNVEILCRWCHMLTDGRLAAFIAMPRRPKQPPKICIDCGQPYKPMRKGRCAACDVRARRARRSE
jgi:hypothetical protein